MTESTRLPTIGVAHLKSIGLVNEVWPNAELKQRAIDLAEELAAMPRVSVATMLRCPVSGEEKPLEESLRDERAAFHATVGTPDMAEGMQAFLEKRAPTFNRD